MRIAVINPFGVGQVYSGPALFAHRLFGAVGTEHEVTMVYGRRGGERVDHPWAQHSVRLTTFSNYSAIEQLMWSVRVFSWLLRHAGDYDYVHIHGGAFFNLVGALGAWCRRTRYAVLVLGGNDLSATAKVTRVPLLPALRRFLVSRAAIAFAISRDIAADLVTLGLPPKKVVALHNPVDTTVYAPPSPRTDPRIVSHTIGFVGTIGPLKRPELVLDAVAMLRQQGFSDARAVVIGPFYSADYERRFRAQIARLGLTAAVEIVGYTTEVWRWMNHEMSVLVHPSSVEGLPGALVEALASGLPAVVTNVGAMGDVVTDAEAGYVVDARSEAIANCVVELWSDRTLWAKRSAAARAYACQHFDAVAVGRAYVAALATVVPTPRRKARP